MTYGTRQWLNSSIESKRNEIKAYVADIERAQAKIRTCEEHIAECEKDLEALSKGGR
jgi:peptidoglycan hydrolase CwlO-like protein